MIIEDVGSLWKDKFEIAKNWIYKTKMVENCL